MKGWKAWLCTVMAVLCVPALVSGGLVHAQTEEQAAPVARSGELMNTANRLRLQLDGYLGFGLDSSTVGKTTKGEDVKISGGGGLGFGGTLGYGLSQHADIDLSLGLQASELTPAVENGKGTFSRSFLLATMKYKIPMRENLQWKFGVGAGYYMGGKLDIDIEPGIPGAGHTVIEYQNATGFHATGELEVAVQRNLVLTVGLKYYMVDYKADKATFNGGSAPVSSLKEDFRTFNGDGLDVTVGLGVLF